MSLLAKLTGEESPKLPVHQFYAALQEMADGAQTKSGIMAAFGLVTATSDESELDFLIAHFQDSANKERWLSRIHGLLVLAESGYFDYKTKSILSARIQSIG